MSDGSYFDKQQEDANLDPWAVIGLHPEDNRTSARGIRLHLRTVVYTHVFVGAGSHGKTAGPKIPTWQHMNNARDALLGVGVINVDVQQRTLMLPKPNGAVSRPRRDRALPKEYCRPEVQDVPDESTASNNNNASPFGSYANPFVVDEDDIPSSARSGPIGSTTGSRPAQPPPTPTTPRRGNAGQPTQTPLAAAPRTPGGRRKEPKGIYLGTRSGSELSGSQSNAVYGSKDRLGRINRRISKEDNAGNVITAGNFDPRVTACKHEDIRYIQRLQGLTRSQVDSMINPMLVVGGGVLALPAPPVASSRAPLRLTWIDLSSAASDDD